MNDSHVSLGRWSGSVLLLFLTAARAGGQAGAFLKAAVWPEATSRGGIYKPRFDRPWKVMNEPFLAGMVLWIDWRDAEPEEGRFDWSYLDEQLAKLDRDHRAMIRFNASAKSPKWVFGLGMPTATDGWGRSPAYWDLAYMEKLRNAILVYGRKYDGHPKVECVHIQVGVWGEVLVNSKEWFGAGYTPEKWIAAIKHHIDFHIEAFRKTPLTVLLSGSLPRSKSLPIIDEIVEYCAERRVGVGFRGMGPDYPGEASFWNWGPNGYFRHIFTNAYGRIPIHAETGWHGKKPPGGFPPSRDADFVWQEVYAQLHYRVNYSNMRADYGKQDLIPAFEFLAAHLGVPLERAADVWVALKPERFHGNYEYWLYQTEALAKSSSGRSGQPVRDWRGTNQGKGRGVVAFGVDPGFVSDSARRFRIEVTYLDEGEDAWALEYRDRSDALRRAGKVEKTGTSAWKKCGFRVEDAAFGRGRKGADFRLNGLADGDDAFHLIRVFRLEGRRTPKPRGAGAREARLRGRIPQGAAKAREKTEPKRAKQEDPGRPKKGSGKAPSRPEVEPTPAAKLCMKLYQEAETHFVDGDIDKARELLKAIVREHPDTEYAAKAKEYLRITE